MGNFVFSVDVERDIHSSNKYHGVVVGLKRLEKLLDKYKIQATFFVTCDCIKKYPKIFTSLSKKGHEIALHGYRHIRYDELTEIEQDKEINKAVACFQKYLKKKPKGFRAPQFSADIETIRLLIKKRFEYDSSYTPLNILEIIFFPKRFKTGLRHFFSKVGKNKINGKINEIPLSSFIFPLSSFSLRVMPLSLFKLLFSMCILSDKTKTIVFLSHSWDFIELKESRTYKVCDLNKFMKKLDAFLIYANKKLKSETLEKIKK